MSKKSSIFASDFKNDPFINDLNLCRLTICSVLHTRDYVLFTNLFAVQKYEFILIKTNNVMKNFLLILNCRVIADFMTYGRALNAFCSRMLLLDFDDVLELVRLSDGHVCASSLTDNFSNYENIDF